MVLNVQSNVQEKPEIMTEYKMNNSHISRSNRFLIGLCSKKYLLLDFRKILKFKQTAKSYCHSRFHAS